MRRPNFERIAAFYRRHERKIMSEPTDWGIDPYAWDHEAGITFTPIESALWADIRAEDLVFYPQYPVGRFFVDFGNPAHKIAIECDGRAWHVDKEKDRARDARLHALGWSVYRISGSACLTVAEEGEDEQGHTVVAPSAARLFIRDVVARHPMLERTRRPSQKGWWTPHA